MPTSLERAPLPTPNARRAAIDSLVAILPSGASDRLAGLLTHDDIQTLRHLAREGMGENSLRALASDLGYLEGWARAATGSPLPWPAPEALALKFVAHHLWDPARHETDPQHGMPEAVALQLSAASQLRATGPHAPATVRRRLSSWSTLHHWKGLEGPFAAPALRAALRLSTRAAARPRMRKSAKAVTADVLERILVTCSSERLVDRRDTALLLVAFASGGRRRSEIARLRVEQLIEEPPVPVDPAEPDGGTLSCLSIVLGRTKTGTADDDQRVLIAGRAVDALRSWLAGAGITDGPVFRSIDRWGGLKEQALTPQAVNLILKRRVGQAGFEPKLFSAHGLRAGYLTEAAKRGISLQEAMQQSQHRSVQQAARYYNDAERHLGKAARILG
ncbi:MAG TPA: site-specific integrase [Methylocella sp.]|nr:site-specific integrase [Methylocella sp.]